MSVSFRRSPSRVRRRTAVPALCAATVGLTTLAVGSVAPGASAAPGDTVQILSFNDYHGHVEDDTAGSIDGSFGGPAAGGGEYLSAKLAELRDANNSFTVAAGDLIGGSPFFSGLFKDEPSVESLNEMGLDVSGVGNHEFDEGIEELIRMQEGGCFDTDDDGNTAGPGDANTAEAMDDCFFPDAPYQGADFQWLAANVDGSASPVAGLEAAFEAAIPPWEIQTADNGEKIAFIGMTLEGTDELVAAAGLEGFTFEDEIVAAAAAVTEIQAADSDVEAIVLLLHEGGIPNPFAINGCEGISGPIVAIAEGVDAEIDAIITGHTHQPYTCTIDDPDTNPRPVVSAWEFGKVVTELNLTFDGDGDIVREGVGAPTMVNHEVLQDDLTADPAVTAVITKWTPLAEAKGNEVVGQISADITRGGDPTGSDRGVESAAGNMVADAQLESTQGLGADVAFMNPGGVRSDLEFAGSDAGEGDGFVTFGEAFTFQPFNNTMFVLPMTGAQIMTILEEQCQPSDSSRPFLHLGVSEGFTYDLGLDIQGGICTDVEISNVKLNGVDLDMATMYQVAVNNFLADGGDNFDTFAEVDPNDRIPGPQDIDALIDYLTNNAPVDPPSTDRVNETITMLPGTTNSLVPARLLDTREGEGNVTVDGEFEGEGPVAAGGEVELVVADRGGIDAGAAAVLLNIAVIRPVEDGFITVYPCGEDRPLAANANYAAGEIVSNVVLATVGEEGKVCIYSSAQTDMTADANGEVASDASPTPVVPSRVLDTRTTPGNVTDDGLFQGEGPIAGGDTLELLVAGRGGVDADAKAVVLNVAAIRGELNGFLTIFPCGADRPLAASVNFVGGQISSNAVVAGIGTDGKVCIYASSTVDVTADVNGFVPLNGTPDAQTPARLLETRVGDEFQTIDDLFEGDGPVTGGEEVELQVTGRAFVGDDDVTVVLNVATVNPAEAGFITIYPCGEERPTTANLNYAGGDVKSNGVIAKIGADGKVCIYTSATTDLVVDASASIPPIVPARPAEE